MPRPRPHHDHDCRHRDAPVLPGSRPRQRERRHPRGHQELRHYHCGNRHRPHHDHRAHRDHRPDLQSHRARHHRHQTAPDGSARSPGLAGAAASCRDSAAVHRCWAGCCGRRSGGYPRRDGVACCSAQPDSRTGRAAAPTNAAARNHRRRRGCCPPGASADPASATAGGGVRGQQQGQQGHCHPRAAAPGAARQADVAESPDAPLREGRAAQGYWSRPGGPPRMGAHRRPDDPGLSDAPLVPHAAESPAERPLEQPPERHCQVRVLLDGRAKAQGPA